MRLDELAVYERGLEERAEWVEHRLHRGALELDERAAALERTARKLESEATRLTELGAELSQREAELGELAAAFNERGARLSAAEAEVLQREERLAGREARVVRLVRRIAERRARVSAAVRAAPPAVAPAPEPRATSHLLLLASAAGYALHEREGPVPERGSEVAPLGEDGRSYRVAGAGPSPLPGDRRRCAYLEPL